MKKVTNPILLILMITSIIGCTPKLKYLGSHHQPITPVMGMHLIDFTSEDTLFSTLPLKAHNYVFGRDSFMIVLVDETKDNLFTQPEDIVVIAPLNSKYVPVLPITNPNVTHYSRDLTLSYEGNLFSLDEVADKGERLKLHYLPKSKKESSIVDAGFSEFIDTTLRLRSITDGRDYSISSILESTKGKYIYFHFWYTACPPCMEEIPYLKVLEKKGIPVINIASSKIDKDEDISRAVTRFNYPGRHFVAGFDVARSFGQNGFPFGVLVEVHSGRKLNFGSSVTDVCPSFFSEN